jgi:signal transduction histidine kinase
MPPRAPHAPGGNPALARLIAKDGTRAEYRDIVGSMLEEVNRLTSLIDNLLTISRADSGHSFSERSCRYDLAREAAGLFEILVEEKSQRLILEAMNAGGRGDRLLLRQALVNISIMQ